MLHTEPLRSTPPSVTMLATQLPNGQSVKAQTPDKSLPVQEKPVDKCEQNDALKQERDRWTPGGRPLSISLAPRSDRRLAAFGHSGPGRQFPATLSLISTARSVEHTSLRSNNVRTKRKPTILSSQVAGLSRMPPRPAVSFALAFLTLPLHAVCPTKFALSFRYVRGSNSRSLHGSCISSGLALVHSPPLELPHPPALLSSNVS